MLDKFANLNDENLNPMDEILLEEQLMNSLLEEQPQAKLLHGKPVAESIMDDNLSRCIRLNSQKRPPTLAVPLEPPVRVV